jgi:hypothetical protein
MAKIYKNDTGVKFLFFTNYKVMNSNLAIILLKYFENIQYYTNISGVSTFLDHYLKLTVVRNPYDRLLSLYEDKCKYHPYKVKNRDTRIYLQNNQAQILRTYSELKNLNINIVEPEVEMKAHSPQYRLFLDNLSILESITFSNFVDISEYLFESPDMDAHFSPQSEIMTINNSMVVDYVFKLENIQLSWGKICKLVKADMELTHGVNRTNFEGPEKYKRFYTKELQKRVFHLYQSDFNYFEYLQ